MRKGKKPALGKRQKRQRRGRGTDPASPRLRRGKKGANPGAGVSGGKAFSGRGILERRGTPYTQCVYRMREAGESGMVSAICERPSRIHNVYTGWKAEAGGVITML